MSGPLEMPAPPRPQRLNRLALIAVLALLGVAVAAVFLTLAPAKKPQAAGEAADGGGPAAPGFLEHGPRGWPWPGQPAPVNAPEPWQAVAGTMGTTGAMARGGTAGGAGGVGAGGIGAGGVGAGEVGGLDAGGLGVGAVGAGGMEVAGQDAAARAELDPAAAAEAAAGLAPRALPGSVAGEPGEPAGRWGRAATPSLRVEAYRRALAAPVTVGRGATGGGGEGGWEAPGGAMERSPAPATGGPGMAGWGTMQAAMAAPAALSGASGVPGMLAEPRVHGVPATSGVAGVSGGLGMPGVPGLPGVPGAAVGSVVPAGLPDGAAGGVAPEGAAAPPPAGVGVAAAGRDHQGFLRGVESLAPAELRVRRDAAAAGGLVLTAGTVLPAALVTAVDSDVAGPLVAQLTQDVFDRDQRQVVLPRGSRLIGAYDSQVALGESRLLVAWSRIIFPDGGGLSFPGLPALTRAGEAGLSGSVDNHLARVFGSAMLLSIVGAGAQLSQPQESAGFGAAASTRQVAAAAVGQELSSVAIELLRRQLQVPPTLRIAAGTRFYVFLRGDLRFAEATPE